MPHTADLRIEAWAPTCGECVTEAVRGLVESFAEIPRGRGERAVVCHLAAASAEDLLAAALDEVIYRMDADGELPAAAELREDGDGTSLLLSQVPVAAAQIVGAVPKAVALSGLRCAPDPQGGWSATVTVDV